MDLINQSLKVLDKVDPAATLAQIVALLDIGLFGLIVFLTAVVSLLIAIRTQFNPGSKWVLLRYATEAIKRAIYIYRTRPVQYFSPQANNVPPPPIPLGKDGGSAGPMGEAKPSDQPAGAGPTGEAKPSDPSAEAGAGAPESQAAGGGQNVAPATAQDGHQADVPPNGKAAPANREGELAQAIERVRRQLMRTDVNQAALPPCTAPVPPEDAVAKGDDGIGFLTPESYIKYRLDDQIEWYHGKTVAKEHELRKWQLISLASAGAGTLLAAVGLDIWVALTTAITGAAISFVQYRQTEDTLVHYNQTAASLESVIGWWQALSPEAQADSQYVRNLVDVSERIMETEQVGWMQQMQDALESLKEERSREEKQPAS